MTYTRRTIFRITAVTLLLCITVFFSVYLVYASFIDSFTKKQSLNVLPSVIDSALWQNTDALYFQDLREEALFQSFTQNNSAFLKLEELKGQEDTNIPQTIETETPSVVPGDDSNGNAGTDAETETLPNDGSGKSPDADSTGSISEDNAPPTDERMDEPSVEIEAPVPSEQVESPPDEIAEPPPEPAPTEPVSLLNSGDTALFPMSSALIRTAHAQSDEQTDAPVEPPTTLETPIDTPPDAGTIVDPIPEPPSDSVPELPVEEPVDMPIVPTSTDAELPIEGEEPNEQVATTTEELPQAGTNLPVNPDHAVQFSGFAIPGLASGESIQNAQIRMSFAAKQTPSAHASSRMSALRVQYTFSSDDVWVDAGTVLIEGEASNAINGGYYLFALPPILDPKDLRKLKVRAVYEGEYSDLENIYIDSLWIELNAMTLDRDALKARVSPEALTELEKPKMHELISDELDFTEEEMPHFALKYEEQRNFAVQFIRSIFSSKTAEIEELTFTHSDVGEIDIPVELTETSEGLWSIQVKEEAREELRPGTYTVELEVNEGGRLFTDTFEFQWGLLAINTQKTRYVVGDVAEVSLGALSQNGNTICDASLELYIIDASAFIRRLPASPSGVCNGNNVVPVPDYSALYSIEATGTYELYVERITPDGAVLSHTSMTFEVADAIPFSLSRAGPTRIYPLEPYTMNLILHANEKTTGTVVERVPAEYEISGTDAEIKDEGDIKTLTWAIDLLPGEERALSYTFDSPDISPYLYQLGPATVKYGGNRRSEIRADSVSTEASSTDVIVSDIGDGATSTDEAIIEETSTSTDIASLVVEDEVNQFTEHRAWQIASDATGSLIVFWSSMVSLPAGWTCVSCSATSTFFQKFIRGAATYGSTGGTATSTHTASATLYTSATVNAENNAGVEVSAQAHSHTLTPNVVSTSTLPLYQQLRMIQSNSAGEPASIPAGAILMFDGTLPGGWSNYVPQNGYYIRGENGVGTTSGSNSHSHSVTGTSSAADSSTLNSRTGGTQVTSADNAHTHTLSTSTTLLTAEPAYIQIILATTTTATSVPTNAIGLWTDTQPAGWLNRSDTPDDPFYQRIIKASSTYSNGGSDTHTHSDMFNSVSSAPLQTDNARTGAKGSSGVHTHQIDITNFTTDSMVPPYVEVIIAKRMGFVPIYTQTSSQWYVNVDANTPTDPWPAGAIDLLPNEPIGATNTPVRYNDQIRLRMQLAVQNSTSTADTLKLQFGTTTDQCSAITVWTDVGSTGSSTAWKGYNNSSVADGATIASSTLSGTDANESYEEDFPTVSTPNPIGIGLEGEWDFSLVHNGADPGTYSCFRMVKTDGTALFGYDDYPKAYTNDDPFLPTLSKLFDNEKVATTSPLFEFYASDEESDDLTYQIQIDNDFDFSSAVSDKNSASDPTQFINLTTPADKDPFTVGETIQFRLTTALSNGTTYYWRVRAKDPTGSNAYGIWSEIHSFTVDTSLTVSAWFQTTEEQFDSSTLYGTDALVSDQVSLIVGSSTGTTTSDAIALEDATLGNAWGSLSWADNETTGDIKYHVQYEVTDGVWALIPDSALSGNTAGYDTSPISLLGLNTDTYPVIRLSADFTNVGGSPTLQDWTVSWGYKIPAPTLTALFPNEKTGTTTPSFEFYTSDPQGDSLVYEFQWSTSSAFTASTTRTSSSSAGFENTVTIVDTSPFNSGELMRYTIQDADRLTASTTYWWRVRAVDPTGSNTFSAYSNAQSFTTDGSVTVSTWFQTTSQQFETDTLSGLIALSTTSITVSTSSSEAMVVYAEGVIQTPRYRLWGGTSWGSELSAQTVGATINWVVLKESPTNEEYLLGTLGTDGDVNMQVYANGSWGDQQEVTAIIPDTGARGFDIAYETSSGDAIVVTCDGDADPTYWVWDGLLWTNGGTVNLSSLNSCSWVKLISDPTSDEIIVISRDNAGSLYEAQVWSGSSWGNAVTWGSMIELTHEGIAAAYEESGNQAVIAVSNGGNANFSWRAWNAGWTAPATQVLGDDFEVGSMAADTGTDNMAICYVDQDTDVGVVRWTGAAWTGQTELDIAGDNKIDRPVDCAFENTTARNGYIMVAYSDTTGLRYQYWNGATWIAEASISTIADTPTVQLIRSGSSSIMALGFDDGNDRYDFSNWANGTTWSTLQTLETNASVGASPFKQPFMMAPRNSATLGTAVVAPEIDFYDGSGPYWQQLSWNDTETGGSSILYQMEYYNTASSTWDLIPDTLIPSNSVGTSTSPMNLANVLPVTTYSLIRPVATLNCDLGVCPSLNDWTVTWSAGITITGTIQQYNETTNVTSGTVAVAVNGVLQAGKTGAIAGGAWSIANVNAAPGDVVTVFVDGAVDANEAIGVTKYDGVGDISGMQLYERHLSIGSNDLATVSNTDLALYAASDEDLFHGVSGSALTVCTDAPCDDAKLYIRALNTYQPAGNITTHDFVNRGSFTPNGNTVRVNGTWDNQATSTMGTSTVIFTATSTIEGIANTASSSGAFYNLTFGETSGTATWYASTTIDVDTALSVNFGTLGRATSSVLVGGSLSTGASGFWTGFGTTTFDGSVTATWSDANSTKQNIGNVLVNGTSKTVQLGTNVRGHSVTIGADDILDVTSANYSLDVLAHWTNNNSFVPNSGTVNFLSTSTGRVINAGTASFYNLTFNSATGTWSFTQPTLSVTNDFTIATGTVTLPTGTTTVAGSFLNTGGAFAHNNGTLYFTTSASKTITLSGTNFTNTMYNAVFNGSGSWTMSTANATTSNDFKIQQGTVTLPSGTLAIGSSFLTTGGGFTHNSGIVRMTSAAAQSVSANGSSFYTLRFDGSGTHSITATTTVARDFIVSAGTVMLPVGTLSVGGSYTNSATVTHSSGTVLFNATTTGFTITPGASALYNMTFNSTVGGWTISNHTDVTNAFTLTNAGAFTMTSGRTLTVNGTFTNAVGGASTTWTGSTLLLQSGTTFSGNTKTAGGDVYGALQTGVNTRVSFWNTSATSYTVDPTGYLYSQDHAGVDGDLYIFGAYTRTSGTEHWSAGTDFDGVAIATSSQRTANVRLSSGATASFSSSTLSIIGTSTATTTVASQSGTYTIFTRNATTTASYYDFTNLGTTGVTLGTSTKVTALSNGAFTPGVAAGTGLTVASTTIDLNPASQFTSVRFATTTAISATNVTQTGGTPASYWWFRTTTGNLAGEAKDSDTGDPGSIRWDDSSYVITVSGVVYQDLGVTPMGAPTCNGASTSVRVVVNGSSTFDGTCAAGTGAYSIPGVTFIGSPVITVFLNTNGGQRGAIITKTPTTNIIGLDIYANRVTVTEEDVAPLTIADMSVYDEDNDTDLRFNATSTVPNTLTVRGNTGLVVATSSTFVPGGNIVLTPGGDGGSYDGTLHIDNDAIFTGVGNETYSVGGRFQVDTGATFTSASSTVTFTATTTGKTISSPSTITFNHVQFTGSGQWDLVSNLSILGSTTLSSGTLIGSGNIDLSYGSFTGNGTLLLSGGTTTLQRGGVLGGTTSWSFYNLALGNGSISGTTFRGGVSTTTVLGQLTVNSAHTLALSGSEWNLAGTSTPLIISGTLGTATSTIRYSGTSATNITSAVYYNLDLNASSSNPTYTTIGSGILVGNRLTVGANGTTTVTVDANDTLLTVHGDILISPRGTLVGSNSGTFTANGNWTNTGTFTSSGGTVTFSTATSTAITASTSSFGNVVVNATGAVTLLSNATSTGNLTLTGASAFTVNSGLTLAVGGSFANNVSGSVTNWTTSTLSLYSGTNYTVNATTTSDRYSTLSVGANTDIRMWNSSATTTLVNSTGSLYSQDNANVNGALYIYADYGRTSGSDYWNYATDFDGTSLLGGNERQVQVYMATSTTLSFTGGSLDVRGSASATTTLQNQSGGTYSFTIGGSASTTLQYYQLRDLGTSGLVLTGSPTVSTLSNGDILISQNSGTGMTIGGTVITANPAKTFNSNHFATNTAISATNVTATSTTVSSWRFANHTGNMSGEAKDNDPGGDPGYIVWDDSSGAITVSGVVYSDEGVSTSTVCNGVTQNVRLMVQGVTSYTTTCNASTGAFSIPGIVYGANDNFTLYLDTAGGVKAAHVLVDPVTSVGDMHLYENRVIVRHENTAPITIAKMATWDSSDDADIPFTAVDAGTDTLTLPANTKLIVWTGKTFTPTGNITLAGGGAGQAYDGTLELYANAQFTAAASEIHSIGGSLITGSGAVFTPATSNITFTTTGAARTVDTNSAGFYDITFNGVGSWTVADSPLTVGNTLDITNGIVTLPSGTTTVGGSFTTVGGSFVNSTGTVVMSATTGGKTISTNGSSFFNLTFSGAGGGWTFSNTNATTSGALYVPGTGTLVLPSGILAVGKEFNNASGTLTHNSGTIKLNATTTSNTFRTNGSDVSSLHFAGTGSYIMRDSSVSALGSVTISTGTVTFATGTVSIGGSLTSTGATFVHSSGTVLFNSSSVGRTVAPGASSFYNLSFANTTGGWTLSGSATTTGNFNLTTATAFSAASGTTLYVQGVFTNLVGGSATTWDGSTLYVNSASGYTINSKSAGGDRYNTLRIGTSTDLRAWNSSATTTLLTASSSLYSQDHGAVDGELYIYGNYTRTTGTDYWDYATDFDGVALPVISRRAVTTRFASGATSTFSGGTLEIVGAAGATTTVTNQGAGTYQFVARSISLNAQYYAFRNADSSGLQLLGTTTITSLGNGDFELAVAGGSLITVASTTVDANASTQHTSIRFATTTAITGSNVTLLGTTTNAITFASHSGNLAGESFDVDGVDACGSIRWDNSSCLLIQQAHYRWRNDDGGESAPDSEWYNMSWSKRKRVVLTNADGTTYTNAAAKVTVQYDSDMQTDFDDLRFTTASGTVLLNHWRETYTPSTNAVVWVQVPTTTASADTSIYMYYGNSGATDGSSGSTTFSTFDDFEDNNITEYGGDTSLFTTGTGFAYDRTRGLDAVGTENSQTTDGIYRVNATTTQGKTIRYFQYINTTTGSSDEACTLFGVQSPGANNNNYAVCLALFGADRVTISKNVSSNETSGTVLATSSISFATGWHEVEIDWRTNNAIEVTVSRSGSVVATTSVTDASYTTGGMGFSYWFQHGGWDDYAVRPYLTTDLAVRFGTEQVPGGASWYAGLDTSASGIPVATTKRLRVIVENTGLAVTGKQLRLDYASKGVAVSCEAVAGGSYVQVPVVASCGASPLCMVASTNYSDLASTTDQIGGAGAYTFGQIIENASNKTASLDLGASTFTEVEYALAPTVNATSPAYCLRVSDNGTPLDSYSRVAELRLRFDPIVSNVTLNSGTQITLSPGGTTTVYATGTVTDANGYADLSSATGTIYRSGVGAQCTTDNSNCYKATSTCSFTDCAGNSCTVSCTANIYYFADPTDIGTYIGEDWRGFISAVDAGGGYGTSTSLGQELLTLRALSVTSAINYGAVEVQSDTGATDATTTILNQGNDAIDISVAGTDMTSGASTIPVSQQKYATTTFTYAVCTNCGILSSTTSNVEVDLTKPTSTVSTVSDDIYWGIAIPFGIAATAHQGSNTFYAISD